MSTQLDPATAGFLRNWAEFYAATEALKNLVSHKGDVQTAQQKAQYLDEFKTLCQDLAAYRNACIFFAHQLVADPKVAPNAA